jgi:metal-responsive CopG/Arc/MetJ family transcriptional regulator
MSPFKSRISVDLDHDLLEEVEEERKRQGLSRNALIALAVREYLRRREDGDAGR